MYNVLRTEMLKTYGKPQILNILIHNLSLNTIINNHEEQYIYNYIVSHIVKYFCTSQYDLYRRL